MKRTTLLNSRQPFITRCIESGIDIETVMNRTGQTKYEMMRKYINTSTDYKIKMAEKFNHNYDDLSHQHRNREKIAVESQHLSEKFKGNELPY